ncbi:hypothetical protein JCM19235_1347 [Vibrio maritimus]|uniref:Uncharacterized protein n=1 Tax=Vibrio maritimus TaxID=990268 RepID=A0A090S682_9VIBR|nr:hypothetical protein JCM19235_1347 [Vibrio maritimus]
MDNNDIELAKMLLPDLPLNVISDKLEVPLHLLAQEVLDCDFELSESVFTKRLAAKRIRLGEDSIERFCPRCEEYYPLVEEFWHRTRSQIGGAHSMCKGCERERKSKMRRAQGMKPYKLHH